MKAFRFLLQCSVLANKLAIETLSGDEIDFPDSVLQRYTTRLAVVSGFLLLAISYKNKGFTPEIRSWGEMVAFLQEEKCNAPMTFNYSAMFQIMLDCEEETKTWTEKNTKKKSKKGQMS